MGSRSIQIDGANDSPQTVTGATDNGSLSVRAVDRDAQEDARELRWSGRSRGTFRIANPRPVDLSTAGPLAVEVAIKVDRPPAAVVSIEIACGPGCSAKADVTSRLTAIAGKGWQVLNLSLACLNGADLTRVTVPFALSTSGAVQLTLSSVALVPAKDTACS